MKHTYRLLAGSFAVAAMAMSAPAQDERLSAALQREFQETAATIAPSDAYEIFKALPRGIDAPLSQSQVLKGAPVEPGSENVASYGSLPEDKKVLERIVGLANFLPAAFLEEGAARQRAVGRVILKAMHSVDGGVLFPGDGWGTGFLVSPSLLMTNHHVMETSDFAEDMVRIQFNFQRDLRGEALQTEEYDLDPDSFFHANPGLDYALVRVKPRREQQTGQPATREVVPGERWGWIRIEAAPLLYLPSKPDEPKQQLNIVQHPNGRHKEIAIHDNFIDSLTAQLVNYTTDTEGGSSGSPIFNNFWQLIGLHHAGGQQVGGRWVNNEGIRMDEIADDIRANLPEAIVEELGLQVESP